MTYLLFYYSCPLVSCCVLYVVIGHTRRESSTAVGPATAGDYIHVSQNATEPAYATISAPLGLRNYLFILSHETFESK